MKISTKGRYGLRCMVDLAINATETHVDLKSISERQDISKQYMEHIFSALKKAGLVKSVKGPQGGYLLSRAAEEISVGDVLRALEGNLSVIDEDVLMGEKTLLRHCIHNNVWFKVNDAINDVVDNISLQFLVNDFKAMQKDDSSMMYYI